MRLAFLATSEPGLRWFHRYYRENPHLRKPLALASFRAARTVLKENPRAGHPFEDIAGVREYPIQGTHFTLLYTVARGVIWIIDLRDARGLRSAEALDRFASELRGRLGR